MFVDNIVPLAVAYALPLRFLRNLAGYYMKRNSIYTRHVSIM
jgi:hypothetical protein